MVAAPKPEIREILEEAVRPETRVKIGLRTRSLGRRLRDSISRSPVTGLPRNRLFLNDRPGYERRLGAAEDRRQCRRADLASISSPPKRCT